MNLGRQLRALCPVLPGRRSILDAYDIEGGPEAGADVHLRTDRKREDR
jgi:hypothetical protein